MSSVHEIQPVLSCGAFYNVAQGGPNFGSVAQLLKCDHSNERHRAVLPGAQFIMQDKEVLTYESCCRRNPGHSNSN